MDVKLSEKMVEKCSFPYAVFDQFLEQANSCIMPCDRDYLRCVFMGDLLSATATNLHSDVFAEDFEKFF